ncbi:hypothetical protein [Leptonema illini]|uniref:Uncharacterized protein n=1 Tax=Leptonema illini DSM 21528 TaxID=929563 RepID=H2CHN5_9LEPT|nr:hypothetical protein [Leptonema illini]EHQ05880.1 hypothetical protein Lepil_1186 [Leptonema illini DSM 21528]
MKISDDRIVFENVFSLETFLHQLDLSGVLRLDDDVLDNRGAVLVKARYPISAELVQKLKGMRGSYPERFSVLMNAELKAAIVRYIAGIAVERIDNWPLMRRLYDLPGHRFRRYIEHALARDGVALACLQTVLDNNEHLDSLLQHALLTMSIVIHGFFRIRMIHVDAFLAGLIFASVDPERHMAAPMDESALNAHKSDALQKCNVFKASENVVDAIVRQRPATAQAEEISEAEIERSSRTDMLMDDFLSLEGNDTGEDSEEDSARDPLDRQNPSDHNEAAAHVIAEALHICRYILYLRARLKPEDHLVREIATRLAYNAKKGLFSMRLVNPLLGVFREYEKEIRAVMHVAAVELKCLYLPSAWAYPKPRPTQMICRLHVLDCPKLKSGWNLTVVSPTEAYGWIGVTLNPGQYLKCELEEEFKGVFD